MGVSLNGGTRQPWVFLLKMIILGCFGETHHFRKHPYIIFPPFFHGNFLEKLEAFATGWDQINRGLRAFEPSGDYVTALIQKIWVDLHPQSLTWNLKKWWFPKGISSSRGPPFSGSWVKLQGLKSWWGICDVPPPQGNDIEKTTKFKFIFPDTVDGWSPAPLIMG